MKKILLLSVMVLLVGCSMQKHCYYFPPLNQIKTAKTGEIMILEYDCFGRATVNECTTSLELLYLGTTANNIRIGRRSGVQGQMIASAGSEGFEQYHFQPFRLVVIR